MFVFTLGQLFRTFSRHSIIFRSMYFSVFLASIRFLTRSLQLFTYDDKKVIHTIN